jgi:sphingomyelin phosphodiesterase
MMRIAVQLHSVEDDELRNSTPGTFKFVTYNLFIRPPGIHSNGEDFKVCVYVCVCVRLFSTPISSNSMQWHWLCRPHTQDERLMDFADVADRYDVLCLQELFVLGSHRRARFLHKVAAKGLRYSVHIPSKKWGVFPPRVIDGGVTILSRFPILETEYELYHDATMVLHWDSRVAVVAMRR